MLRKSAMPQNLAPKGASTGHTQGRFAHARRASRRQLARLARLVGLLAFFCIATLLRPGVVLALSGCTTPTDCDGDETNNYEDPCPGSAGSTLPGLDPLRAVRGFRTLTCYAKFVPATPACIPVAVRPFDDLVPDDSLRPSGSKTRRVGFTYVGVYDVSSGGPAATATQVTPERHFRRMVA